MAMPAKAATPQRRFGEVVRSERKRQRLTQEELAHRSGISAVFMSDIERGVENVTIQTISKLSRGLGVKLGELLLRADI
jgi:transcriptional regulator with XRE-family HTH domain